MALFKRKRDTQNETVEQAVADDAVAEATPEVTIEQTPAEPEVPVNISMSSFGGFGAAAAPSRPVPQAGGRTTTLGPELPPEITETVPGLRDNVLLREALAELPENPSPEQVAVLARNLLQGHLFLRVQGDARELLAAGKDLPLAIVSNEDKKYVLAYSSGRALQASVESDGNTQTSAMGQPVMTVLRHVLDAGFDGVAIDVASGTARVVYPRTLLQKLVDEAEPSLAIKQLLASERTPETRPALVEALGSAKFWVAVNTSPEGRVGIAEMRTAEGERYIEVYSHPLELLAVGRGDRPGPLTAAQLKSALSSDDAITGIIIDPAGPWIRLSRDELQSLPDAAPAASAD